MAGIEDFITSEYTESVYRQLDSPIFYSRRPEGWVEPVLPLRLRFRIWRHNLFVRLTPVVLIKRSTIESLEDQARLG